jgi:hypothetical protein
MGVPSASLLGFLVHDYLGTRWGHGRAIVIERPIQHLMDRHVGVALGRSEKIEGDGCLFNDSIP